MRFTKKFATAAIVLAMAAVCLLTATNVSACSRFAPFSADELFVADIIVRATAVRYVKEPDPSTRTTGLADSTIEFKVEEVLRGKNVQRTLILNGYLSDKNDYNDMPVPYTFVRKNGRAGSCFANTYRRGGQFLLFLRKMDDGGYTPNISPLGPTNEQLRNDDDPWLAWTRMELVRRGG